MIRKPNSLFQKILHRAKIDNIPARTYESRRWFINNVDYFRGLVPSKVVRQKNHYSNFYQIPIADLIGSMFMFTYDPKTKESLPYYDAFPLSIITSVTDDDQLLGINLHYLPIEYRAFIFNQLLSITNNLKYDDSTRFNLKYKMLKKQAKMHDALFCVKKYIPEHVRSNILKVNPSEWELAIFLPVERFKKTSKEEVWANASRHAKRNR